jgi:hypothetical protein
MYKNEENGLAFEAAPSPEIAPHIAKYRAALADVAMTNEKKDEFLLTLWEILSNMVRLGFDVSGFDLCGQLERGFNEFAAPDSAALDSMQTQSMEHARKEKEERNAND